MCSATSGIGRATALLLAKEGATVTATGRNADELKALQVSERPTMYLQAAPDLRLCALTCGKAEAATPIHVIAADLTVAGDCERVVAFAAESMGGLTTLVNAAGLLAGGAFGR